MIKKIITKKIIVTSIALFAIGLLCVFPKEENKSLDNIEQYLEYVDNETQKHDVFLLDANNYIALTNIIIEKNNVIDIAKELLEVLIIDGAGEAKIPNGFKSIIPLDTEIKQITYDNQTLKINLSKEFIDVKKEMEEKIIESIVFTLTSIEGVDGVIIYKDGQILSKLPQTGKIMPAKFDRSYGINKKYNMNSIKDMVGVTVYYINEHNGNYYYVPVTNYVNDTRDKISIIIEELSNNYMYVDDLMSFLSQDVQLINSEIVDNMMVLEFNDAIFNSLNEKDILEEVIYTILFSVSDNYNIDTISLEVENEEICKKSIE